MTTVFIEDIGTGLDDSDGSAFVYKLKNSDLTQGKEFLNYENIIEKKTLNYLPFLELTSIPGLTSINEAFTGDDSLRAKNTVVGQAVSENEKIFNKTLSDYSTLQQQYDNTKVNGKPTGENEMVRGSPPVSPRPTSEPLRQLAEFKNKLVEYAKKINNDMSSLQVDDESLRGYILEKQAKLNNYINTLENVTSKPKQGTKYYHYLMWFIVLVTISYLFMYILTSKLVMNTAIALAVAIIALVVFLHCGCHY